MAKSCWKFVAHVFLLHHTGSGVKKGFQTTLYVASAMQTAIVDTIEGHEVCRNMWNQLLLHVFV